MSLFGTVGAQAAALAVAPVLLSSHGAAQPVDPSMSNSRSKLEEALRVGNCSVRASQSDGKPRRELKGDRPTILNKLPVNEPSSYSSSSSSALRSDRLLNEPSNCSSSSSSGLRSEAHLRIEAQQLLNGLKSLGHCPSSSKEP